jgi:hypothetical protein
MGRSCVDGRNFSVFDYGNNYVVTAWSYVHDSTTGLL